ncbi:MAG: hypothetical protein O3B04_04975 [Chloroflexi bacterium]|nr:hypothetical protein [Chloroflexota bacterium]
MELTSGKQVRQDSAAPVLLGISGIDCSGKSTLADAVVKHARNAGIRSELAHVDDFIIPPARRKSEGTAHIDYFENTFDHEAFAGSVRQLASDPAVRLVIGEGIFLFRREMAGLWHKRVWLEMTGELSAERGAARDANLFGSSGNARDLYLSTFVPAHEYHMERDRPACAADLVFEVR